MTQQEYHEGVPSTAAVFGHPLHPMIVPFPIAFLVGALLTDLAFWRLGDPFWAQASIWLIAAGVVSGALAAVFGLTDFLTIRRARAHLAGWVHFLGNLTAVVISLINWIMRIGHAPAAVVPVGLVLSLVVTLVLLVTGWMGGELAYRYKVGVLGDGRTEDARVVNQTGHTA